MKELQYEDYADLGIFPSQDVNGGLFFSKANIDFIIEKYLKLQKQCEELKSRLEQDEEFYRLQFNMARADAKYHERECLDLREQIKSIKTYEEKKCRFMEINAGLKRECRKYKNEISKLKELLKLGKLPVTIAEENEQLKGDLEWEKEQHNVTKLELADTEKDCSKLEAEVKRLNKALEMCKHIERYDIGDMLKENVRLKQQLKTNTHQICDMIKENYKQFDNLDKFDWQGFEKLLDQIEKEKKI